LFVYYARKPTRLAAFWLALVTELALLFRHDLGVYAAIGILVFLLTHHGWGRPGWRRVASYVGFVVVLTLPYLAYLSFAGFTAHLSSAIGFSRAEALRTGQWATLLTSGTAYDLWVIGVPIAAMVWLI